MRPQSWTWTRPPTALALLLSPRGVRHSRSAASVRVTHRKSQSTQLCGRASRAGICRAKLMIAFFSNTGGRMKSIYKFAAIILAILLVGAGSNLALAQAIKQQL